MSTVVKSEIIKIVAKKLPQLSVQEVELTVKKLLELLVISLSKGERVEIRGLLGTLISRVYVPRSVRNPKSSKWVGPKKQVYSIHFTPANFLKEAINDSRSGSTLEPE